ncbi:hypothetical protein E2C01_052827 [Portunus trituberculatus]|uniref:Uncharacterized protein n=1 Tax=Portunus trituberculatus TaxID=210409 RepID=A0A5B7GP90_PORTR|nr:hypothetical protein [Portunus trituberculatus]
MPPLKAAGNSEQSQGHSSDVPDSAQERKNTLTPESELQSPVREPPQVEEPQADAARRGYARNQIVTHLAWGPCLQGRPCATPLPC